jgi:hypothetical protein
MPTQQRPGLNDLNCQGLRIDCTYRLMGDWWSEVIADTSTFEISARVKTLETGRTVLTDLSRQENCSFLHTETLFFLTVAF